MRFVGVASLNQLLVDQWVMTPNLEWIMDLLYAAVHPLQSRDCDVRQAKACVVIGMSQERWVQTPMKSWQVSNQPSFGCRQTAIACIDTLPTGSSSDGSYFPCTDQHSAGVINTRPVGKFAHAVEPRLHMTHHRGTVRSRSLRTQTVYVQVAVPRCSHDFAWEAVVPPILQPPRRTPRLQDHLSVILGCE